MLGGYIKILLPGVLLSKSYNPQTKYNSVIYANKSQHQDKI